MKAEEVKIDQLLVFGGTGWDRAVRGFRSVVTLWAACGEEHEVCVPLWRSKDPGPDSLSSWEVCLVGLPDSSHHGRLRGASSVGPVRRSGQLAVVRLADARCRSEHWEAEHRRQTLFHDSIEP